MKRETRGERREGEARQLKVVTPYLAISGRTLEFNGARSALRGDPGSGRNCATQGSYERNSFPLDGEGWDGVKTLPPMSIRRPANRPVSKWEPQSNGDRSLYILEADR